MSRHVRRLIMNLIKNLNFTSVLDVGCGEGSLLREIMALRPDLSTTAGIDISEGALELAKVKVPEASFYLMDIQTDKLDASFDLVVCSEVLEHVEKDQEAISKLVDMTRHYLLVVTLQGKMRYFESHVGHVRNYKKHELVNMLSNANLNVDIIKEWGYPFYSPLYRDTLNYVPPATTEGQYGLIRRLICSFIYYVMFLNSKSKGDLVFCLCSK